MPESIDRGGVADLLTAGHPVIDVLPPQEHEELRIAGSLGIWIRQLDPGSVDRFSRNHPIVVYCHDFL